MKRAKSTKPTLQEVANHFEEWRCSKRKGQNRIPVRLWSEAVGLLADHPISHVAKSLRLSGSDLKKRQAALPGTRINDGDGNANFVEVAPTVVDRVSRSAAEPVRMELERPDGLRLRIESGNGNDLLRLVERFMENRPCCS